MDASGRELFIARVHRQYLEALEGNDTQGMLDASYTLLYIYAHLGNILLANKWAAECEKHTDDSAELMRIKMALVTAIVKWARWSHS